MAISYVTSQSVNGLSTGGNLAIDCTGANMLLAYVYGNTATIAQITGLTYNGVAMTRAVGIDQTYLTGANTSQSIWYLAAPASGSHNITITISGGGFADIGAACYSGTKQTGIPDATASFNTNDTATSKTLSITTSAANCWTFLGNAANAGGLTASTGSTERQNVNTGLRKLFDSNGALSAGSNSMSWTYTSGPTAAVMVSFAPSVPSANGNFLAFM